MNQTHAPTMTPKLQPFPSPHLMRTGRTTRMLEHAKRLSAERRAVYVIAANEMEVRRLQELIGDGNHGIKVETPKDLSNLDWHTLTLRRAHPNCVVLVDHYAIESRFAAVFQMLHAYDLPPTEPAKN